MISRASSNCREATGTPQHTTGTIYTRERGADCVVVVERSIPIDALLSDREVGLILSRLQLLIVTTKAVSLQEEPDLNMSRRSIFISIFRNDGF